MGVVALNHHGWSTYPHVRYPHEKYSLNKALLRKQLWLITRYEGLICHGGTFHGGMLTSHEIIVHILRSSQTDTSCEAIGVLVTTVIGLSHRK